jgi:hypothetical protein
VADGDNGQEKTVKVKRQNQPGFAFLLLNYIFYLAVAVTGAGIAGVDGGVPAFIFTCLIIFILFSGQ